MQFLKCGLRRLRLVLIGTIGVVPSLLITLPVSAQGNSAIAQGFKSTDQNISATAIVSMQKGSSNSIELANATNTERLVGVVSNKPLIELSGGGSGLQVVTSGLTMTLVSDINGPVAVGDKITASPIAGVGMKATESTTVVGTAQGSLSAVSTDTRTITAKNGKQQTVHIGLLPVQVSVSYFTIQTGKSSIVPTALQNLANSVAGGRNVSPVRVLVAALILLLLFVSVTVLLYSAVRSSIISIGRNPLSESAVRKSLVEVGLTVAAVLALATLIIYLVLTV